MDAKGYDAASLDFKLQLSKISSKDAEENSAFLFLGKERPIEADHFEKVEGGGALMFQLRDMKQPLLVFLGFKSLIFDS